MSTPSPDKHALTQKQAWLLVALISVIGVLPYLAVLDYWPWSSDSVKWYSRTLYTDQIGSIGQSATAILSVIAPVAALSMVANSLIGGVPFMYRFTDLALFVLCGWALYHLWNQLFPRSATWGLLTVGLFYCHPSAQDILPFLARRTYLLAVLFSTVGLAEFCRFLNTDQREQRVLYVSCACLVLALFSNEFAYISVGVVVLLTLRRADIINWQSLRPAALPVVLAIAALGVRRMVLGNHGGYKVSYFADIRHGERVTTVGADGWQIIDASLQYTFFPSGLTGDAHWVFGGAVGTTAVLAYYAWRAVLRPVLNWHRPQERLKVYLSVWILAYSLSMLSPKPGFGDKVFRWSSP